MNKIGKSLLAIYAFGIILFQEYVISFNVKKGFSLNQLTRTYGDKIILRKKNNKSIYSNYKEKKRNNNLFSIERSIDKVTGNFMCDKDLFLEVDKKQKMIEEIEKMQVLNYENIKKYLDKLSENDVYEEVINHKIYLYKKNNEKDKQNNLIKVQNFLNPHIISLRKKKAKTKVEYLIASMVKGENIDQIITEMFQKKLIDIYVLTFIDDKIIEANSKLIPNTKLNFYNNSNDISGYSSGNKEEMSLSEKILRALKDRILAQQKLNAKGTFDFTRILFLSTTLDMKEDREPIIKSVIKSIEQLEEMELYLLDALDYAQDNEKMKKYIPHMEVLLNACKKMNPVNNQLLNKQNENVRFFPENMDTSHFNGL
ncbi:conserved Plasmodium protein, unknown function [Plasmodium berghei]|uniref:Uncharacterized protein n=2 Tax=Plasmodium berghei TaxID=5821 RepID=A0A509AQJ4_PLABA|nr:conserved protein, unknown function [Plasmodium berghei ANKA]CXI78238.1 conserved Plasmodium protein, unknown function [Plasmodium berghei]SCM25154.1 conserved Plasmodium protein, unknown function [Plasmodium berghei]SCN27279.1 conserved Plasmodium protein, unknown function [Plasmodium berghei]SCO63705.1 conserved Plasmodium protein, unknown function [Plasmodium berghei]VUC57136.1 conserved protein, unknown function [Plasmodium berghei ANKA]|eukprot:XP_034422915.1 conserved protein, unknown function [Plasmodium berghei ANKA]